VPSAERIATATTARRAEIAMASPVEKPLYEVEMRVIFQIDLIPGRASHVVQIFRTATFCILSVLLIFPDLSKLKNWITKLEPKLFVTPEPFRKEKGIFDGNMLSILLSAPPRGLARSIFPSLKIV
jgi:hypothetical protein